MADLNSETEFLRSLLPSLEAEGYAVVLEPPSKILPPFLQGWQPDAIATGKAKNLVIEVVRSVAARDKKLDQMAALVRQHPDWELRVLTAPGRPDALEPQPIEIIKSAVSEVRQLSETRHFPAALLMCWAALEALGRMIAADSLARPQTPARLVQVLAQEGYITPSEADLLRQLAEKRNAVIHGVLGTPVEISDIDQFACILDKLIGLPEVLQALKETSQPGAVR